MRTAVEKLYACHPDRLVPAQLERFREDRMSMAQFRFLLQTAAKDFEKQAATVKLFRDEIDVA